MSLVGLTEAGEGGTGTPPRELRQHFLRSMPPKAKVGAGILAFFVLIAIIGPAIAPYDPSAINSLQNTPLGPNSHHLLGTAVDGGDIFSQLLVSIRGTVELGMLTASIATVLSVAIGVTSGFLGGAADEGLSLLTNIFLVLPALPLLIVVLGYFPHAGVVPTAIVLAVLGWAWGARVIRAQTLTLRGRDFVAAARETGERTWRLVVFEVLPNEVSLIAANFVGTFLYAILTSVALAFIGEANLSAWTLGVMLYWAQNASAINIGAWWMYLPPGLAVAILGMSLVLLNFGFDELGNPRLRAASRRRLRSGQTAPAQARAWRPTDPTPVQRLEVTT
jgi:peptide/nickel transport system permease protein